MVILGSLTLLPLAGGWGGRIAPWNLPKAERQSRNSTGRLQWVLIFSKGQDLR